jgi:hypothetical protein
VAIFAVLAAAVVALTTPLGTDYVFDAGPTLSDLARGDLAGAAATEPQMGPLSVLLRWPAAAFTEAVGGGVLAEYRAGALVCLLVVAAFVTWLLHLVAEAGDARDRRAARRRDPAVVLLLSGILIAGPVVVRALEMGHPEEPLGAALCVAALILAVRGRRLPAAIVLGLAMATKQWALLAVGPVLLALPDGRSRLRLAAIAFGIAAAFTLIPLVADPRAFLAALDRPATGLHEMRPGNLWNLVLGHSQRVDVGGAPGQLMQVTFVPGWLRVTAHPGVVVLGVIVPLLWWRSTAPGTRRSEDLLALLALILLLRCVLDPWNHEYYHVPFLTALAAWEVLVARRAPLATAVSGAVLWLVFARMVSASGESTLANVVYVGWATLAVAVLVRCLWWPAAASRRPVRAPAALA